MPRIRDEAAYEQAMRKWVIPECLHVPIVARDEAAIVDHIGDIVRVLSPGKALLVAVDPPPPRDERLPIWSYPRSAVFFEPTQVWVAPSFTRYRQAYIRGKGVDSVDGTVLAHVYNRRIAVLRGYGFIRLVPLSRSANSSSAFSEQWGVDLAVREPSQRKNRIQYADLCELMVMLDIRLGGGVMEVFRIGQNLIEVPGIRPPQT